MKTLDLRAIQQIWHIEYQATTSSRLAHCVRIGEQTNVLTVYGNVNDIARTRLFLKKWLQEMAKRHLIPWLHDLSHKHNLPFNKVTIRGQRTLWGSCNHIKNISLNYKLLFLPRDYVEHLMLHELCHTKHLNHSSKFWNLLAKLDPNCHHNKAGLRQSETLVPQFV